MGIAVYLCVDRSPERPARSSNLPPSKSTYEVLLHVKSLRQHDDVTVKALLWEEDEAPSVRSEVYPELDSEALVRKKTGFTALQRLTRGVESKLVEAVRAGAAQQAGRCGCASRGRGGSVGARLGFRETLEIWCFL
jgi:hypothetical protein